MTSGRPPRCLLSHLCRLLVSCAIYTEQSISQAKSLWADVVVDELRNCGTERLLLVGADPDQVPVGALDACRQSGAETSAGADADAALVQRRRVRDAGELELTCPDLLRGLDNEALGEVSLYAANQVVVLGLPALPG
jgi:hypothetical protein